MNTTAALRVFARVVERGSMTAAAADLGISQPAVSKVLRELEAHTGARLLQRSSRRMRPSDQGKRLYEATGGALSTIDAAIESLRDESAGVTGHLHVHGPLCLGEGHLSAIVLDFQARHPDVDVRLTLQDGAVDLIETGVDLAVRVGQPESSNLIARRIGASRRILCASPDYLKRCGSPKSRRDLAGHDLIVTERILSPRGTFSLCRGNTCVEVAGRAVLTTNNPQVLLRALEAGRGIGVAQQLLVSGHLKARRLVRVLPNDEVKPTDLYLTYPSSKFVRPVVRAFIDVLVPAVRRIDGIF